MTDKDSIIRSTRAPDPVGPYPHARRVGDFIFVSGIGPREKGSTKIPGVEMDGQGNVVSYDIETECRSVFKNIGYILEDAGSSLKDVIDVTVFLTDIKRDFATYNKIYREYFRDAQPARTTVEVPALPTTIHIEVKCVAYVKG